MKKLLAIVLLILAAGAFYYSQKSDNQLTVLNWDYYIGPTTISDFEKASGSSVVYELFKSNEEALAKIKANPGVYDIVIPSDYMVDILKKEDLLEPLDKEALANISNIPAEFRGSYFDPNLEYSVPYAFGTTGFGVNTKAFSGTTITWKMLSEPQYKGKIAVIDDMRFVLGSVLMELGYSPNTVNPAEIDAAVALFQTVVPNIQKFTADSPVELMVSEGAMISYAYNGDVLQMQDENENIRFLIPPYGTLKFLDSVVIPKDAPHKEAALAFINFLLDPEVSAAITKETHYGNPNTAARAHIEADILENPTTFPPDTVVQKLQFVRDVGEDLGLYDKAWEKVKQ